jgi:hypothetical protein
MVLGTSDLKRNSWNSNPGRSTHTLSIGSLQIVQTLRRSWEEAIQLGLAHLPQLHCLAMRFSEGFPTSGRSALLARGTSHLWSHLLSRISEHAVTRSHHRTGCLRSRAVKRPDIASLSLEGTFRSPESPIHGHRDLETAERSTGIDTANT